jgi:hypothetical protein
MVRQALPEASSTSLSCKSTAETNLFPGRYLTTGVKFTWISSHKGELAINHTFKKHGETSKQGRPPSKLNCVANMRWTLWNQLCRAKSKQAVTTDRYSRNSNCRATWCSRYARRSAALPSFPPKRCKGWTEKPECYLKTRVVRLL